ncbi:CoA pyrophosphatase [Myxococcota bacterium]|nr:CoA pyrophosphatase [Myxococcota bacterium]
MGSGELQDFTGFLGRRSYFGHRPKSSACGTSNAAQDPDLAMLLTVTHLPEIRDAFRAHKPNVLSREGRSEAAVALVFRETESNTEVLFIERAQHPDDPWSGHMAFPGGRRDSIDSNTRDAAERETREEVGLDLAKAEFLGPLVDLEGFRDGKKVGLVISSFAFFHPEPEELVISEEVAEALWVPVEFLWEPSRQIDYAYRDSESYPGIKVSPSDRHVVWGLTYRMVQNFLAMIGATSDTSMGPNP